MNGALLYGLMENVLGVCRNFTKVEFSLFWILVCFRGKLKTMNILQYKLLEPFYIRI